VQQGSPPVRLRIIAAPQRNEGGNIAWQRRVDENSRIQFASNEDIDEVAK
jgi:hypothetical protein